VGKIYSLFNNSSISGNIKLFIGIDIRKLCGRLLIECLHGSVEN